VVRSCYRVERKENLQDEDTKQPMEPTFRFTIISISFFESTEESFWESEDRFFNCDRARRSTPIPETAATPAALVRRTGK
jgi:hypothetical protein